VRRAFLAATALACSLVGLASQPVTAATSVDVQPSINDASDPIRVSVPPDASEASVGVVIVVDAPVQAGDGPVFAAGVARPGSTHPSSLPVPTGMVVTLAVGATDVTRGAFVTDSAGPTPATLTVKGATSHGTFEVDLLGRLPGQPFAKLATIEVSRYPSARLGILEAVDGVVTVEPRTQGATVRLTVVGETLGTASLVRLEVPPLRTADGTPAEVTKAPNALPATFGPDDETTVEFDVTLPAPGTYSASMDLEYDGASHPFSLKVSWVRPALGIEVTSAQGSSSDLTPCWPKITASIDPFDVNVSEQSCTQAAVWLLLHETMGRKSTVNVPSLESVIQTEGTKTTAWPVEDVSVALDCTGVSPSPSLSTATSTTCAGASLDGAAGLLVLEPGADARLKVSIGREFEAGQYTAKFGLTGDGVRQTAEAVIFLREPVWVAALFLVIGCALGYGVRRWLGIDRARSVQLRRTASLASLLAEARKLPDLDAEEQDVLRRLAERIETLFGGIERSEVADPDAEIDELTSRVGVIGDWRQLRSLVERLPDDLRDQYRPKVAERDDLLGKTRRLKPEELDSLTDTRIVGEIKASAKADVEARAKAALGVCDSLADPTKKGACQAAVGPLVKGARDLNDHEEWRQARIELEQAKRTADGFSTGQTFGPQATGPVGAAPPTPPAPAATVDWKKRVRDLDTRIKVADRVAIALITAFAIVSGLAFLWAPDPTWGGWPDYVVAIGWAAGLQEAATATFGGVMSLRTKLSTAGP
jgi:hypothetical protein